MDKNQDLDSRAISFYLYRRYAVSEAGQKVNWRNFQNYLISKLKKKAM